MLQNAYIAARIALGLIFVVMGADYFVSFLPEMPASIRGTAFLEALLATGYLFPLIKVVEVVSGVLLLSGRAILPALLLAAPIAVNIGLYHAFLDRNGAWLGFLTSGLTVLLFWPFRQPLLALFQLKPVFADAVRSPMGGAVSLTESRQSS
jgi:putative oxidoreductase